MKIIAKPFTLEDFPGDLEELAQDFDKWKSPEYEAFMMAAAYIRELIKYQALGTPSELAELVKARDEGRILPEGYGCLMSSDNKTLYVWYPEGKFAAVSKQSYIVPSGERRCDHE